MASITQYPSIYNSAYVPNVFVVDGIGAADRYVLQVRTAGGIVLANFKQPANASGVGIFDVQRVLQSYLNSQAFVQETEKVTNTPGALFRYQVFYGTETGTETLLTNQGITYTVINAYDNWRVINSDLFPFLPTPTPIDCELSPDINAVYAETAEYLTNYPGNIPVTLNDWGTLSFFNIINAGPNNWVQNEAPFWVRITTTLDGVSRNDVVYSISNDNGLNVRTDCNDPVVVYPSDAQRIGTVGTGPLNIAPLFTLSYDAYQVRIYSYNTCNTDPIIDCGDYADILDNYIGDLIFTKSYTLTAAACGRFEPIQLSFINQYGVTDYFTFNKRNTRQTVTERNNYTEYLGTWSAPIFEINQQGRGTRTFSSNAKTSMTLSSDWMSDNVSEWLQELYQSPAVNIYVDGQWEPCNLMSNTYIQKTNARNKLFQHEVIVQFANNQKIQRG